MALRPFLLLLLLLAATLLITQAQGIGSSASDCCLKYSQRAIPSGVVTSYRVQGTMSGCLLPAVVKPLCCSPRFTTRRKRKICASPTDNAVQKLMQHLDQKAKNGKTKKGQTQRPKGRPKKQRRQRA